MTQPIQPIPTRYAGCHFRSRLEARWAVFFDHLGIAWQYETQGYIVGGRPYLPDFLLVDCGTWVEVKGNPEHLDTQLIEAAVHGLPRMPCQRERGPKLLLLGSHPRETQEGDWGWLGFDLADMGDGEEILHDGWYGFGSYSKNARPWLLLNTSSAPPYGCGEDTSSWLTPMLDVYESGVPDAYRAARSARFEHGESGSS